MGGEKMRHRLLLPLLLVAALLTIADCADAHPQPSDAEATAFAEISPSAGEPVKFFFYTHCGVESARIGGHWWHAARPLYGDGEGVGPPAGWDNPYQEGQLTVESPKRAVFTAKGTKVVLTPALPDAPVRICS
jgi:hypothetical protein